MNDNRIINERITLAYYYNRIPYVQHPPSLCVATRGEPYPCGFWETYFDSSKFQMEVTSSSTSYDKERHHMSRIVRTKVPPTVLQAYTAAIQAREQ